jgi:hypothetical protein
LIWAIEGLKTALLAGSIVLSEDSKEEKLAIDRTANFLKGFIDECLELIPGKYVPNPDFCLAVQAWYATEHSDRPGDVPSRDKISKAIAASENLGLSRKKVGSERRVYGCQLNAEGRKSLANGKSWKNWQERTAGVTMTGSPNQGDTQGDETSAQPTDADPWEKKGVPSGVPRCPIDLDIGDTWDTSWYSDGTPRNPRNLSRKPKF